MFWKMRKTWLATAALLIASLAPTAQAGWGVGVSIGIPVYGRPCYGPHYCYPYYRPAFVVAPTVAVVQPAPVYVAPAPVAVVPATVAVPAAAPVVARSQSEVVPVGTKEQDIQRYQQQLQSPEPRDRADAVVQLGRLHAPGSVGSLSAALNNDRSPMVREAAARGLGLIGSPDSLDALQRAAQSDDDKTVRSSASYSADLIRTNLAHR
jgi:hypothetical protein